MNFRKPWIFLAGASALLASAQLMAQQDMPAPPPPPPAPQAPMPPPPPTPPADPSMTAPQDMPTPPTPQTPATPTTDPSTMAPQGMPVPPPPQSAPMPAPDAAAMPQPGAMPDSSAGAVFQTPQGEVTVRSSMPPATAEGTPPPFEQLAGSSKWITQEQASVYPLLANDFDYADRNKDNRISASEYASWSNPK